MKTKINNEMIELAIKLQRNGSSYRDIEKLLGISKSVIHKWVKLASLGSIKQTYRIQVSYPVQLILTIALDSKIEEKAGKKIESNSMIEGRRCLVFEFPNRISEVNAIKRIEKIHSLIEIESI